jgi:hypothetical protein
MIVQYISAFYRWGNRQCSLFFLSIRVWPSAVLRIKSSYHQVSSPRTTTRLPPPTVPTTTDHDYISDDRNDDFDGVNRNHAFDNDFDLDMHEPGD